MDTMNKRNRIWDSMLLVMAFALLITSSCENDEPNIDEPNRVPGKVMLDMPAKGATKVVFPNTTLSWQAVIDPDGDAITYDVYISKDAIPSTIVSAGQIALSYNTNLEINTTYHWKVVAIDSKGGESESEIWSFTTDIVLWSDDSHGAFTDPRDNKAYSVLKIGDQLWFTENLAYEIPGKEVIDNIRWQMASEGWCLFSRGILYKLETAKTASPDGWHLPTDEEWKQMEMHLGMNQSEADNTGWRGTDQGSQLAGLTDKWPVGLLINSVSFGTSGFTAIPGGHRSVMGMFSGDGTESIWWVTEGFRMLNYNQRMVYRSSGLGTEGFSVRCVRD